MARKGFLPKSVIENRTVQEVFGNLKEKQKTKKQPKVQEVKACPECGKTFPIRRNSFGEIHQIFCSAKCQKEATNRKARERRARKKTEYTHVLNEETWEWELKK